MKNLLVYIAICFSSISVGAQSNSIPAAPVTARAVAENMLLTDAQIEQSLILMTTKELLEVPDLLVKFVFGPATYSKDRVDFGKRVNAAVKTEMAKRLDMIKKDEETAARLEELSKQKAVSDANRAREREQREIENLRLNNELLRNELIRQKSSITAIKPYVTEPTSVHPPQPTIVFQPNRNIQCTNRPTYGGASPGGMDCTSN